MTVWWLANVASYREVSKFGIRISTVAVTIVEICHAMEMLLLCKTVYLGETQKVKKSQKWGGAGAGMINASI